jgi:phosphate starvation-inducible protein PhoH
MIIVGDVQQTDLKDRKMSGLYFLNKAIAGHIPGTVAINLKNNHRHEIVEPILNIYKELNS